MAKISEQPRLLLRVALANLATNDEGLAITPLLSGPHGIGKSMIIRNAAKKCGGRCITIECSQIGEGVVSGLPVAVKTNNGSTEVRFVKFYAVNQIAEAQKVYYEKATTVGFLNGRLKMNPETGIITYIHKDGKKEEFQGRSKIDNIFDGEENRYQFGENLPLKIKLELIESKEMQLVFLFLDEINRCEMMTQKEFMNIILNRAVNGYKFPWWVSIVAAMNPSSQNSSYATNEMDPAQLDRFLKLTVSADLNNWVDYATEKNLSIDIISGIAVSGNELLVGGKDGSLIDTDESKPSPRSWEMVSNLYSTFNELGNTAFFTPEERTREVMDADLRALMIGKVGRNAADIMLRNISNKENTIRPEEFLNGKAPEISDSVKLKYKKQNTIMQKITADNVIRYMQESICDYEKKKDEKGKKEFENYTKQMKEFFDILSDSIQLSILKKLTNFEATKCADGQSLFLKVTKYTKLSAGVLAKLSAYTNDIKQLGAE